MFDDFDTAGALGAQWDLADNPVECTSKSKMEGYLMLECHSRTTGKTELSIRPEDEALRSVLGVAMLAKVDNPVNDTWGKLHLKVSLRNINDDTSRTFLMSLRGRTANVSELGGESTSVGVAPGEFHLLEVNYEDQQLTFRVDGTAVDYDPHLTQDFQWGEWALEVTVFEQSSGVKNLTAQVDWVAIKP